MAFEPILAWDRRSLIASESSFGTPTDPASSQAIELATCDLGLMQQGQVHAQKDKTQGRGMTNKFVEGRVQPIAFNLEGSVRSRAAVDTTPKESVIYQAAGMRQTTNAGTSVVYDFISNPTLYSMSILKTLGTNATTYAAEWLRGGIVKSLGWMGGDKELTFKASGAGVGKYHGGFISSITLADGSGTTMTVTAEESYRLTEGMYMIIESEVIKIGAFTYGGTSVTIQRAQLSTTGAAHTAQPLMPYYPSLTLAGSPIPEGTFTVALDGVTVRAHNFEITLETGIDHLPGESGSAYSQGARHGRYDCKVKLGVTMHREDTAFEGKVRARRLTTVSIVQGTGTGSIATFSLPYCEFESFNVPDTENDRATADLTFRARDNSGNDMMTLTLT
jgi:hypothetical protein